MCNCAVKICINDHYHLGCLKKILRIVSNCLCTSSEETRNIFSTDSRGTFE